MSDTSSKPTIGIINISDRASKQIYEPTPGLEAKAYLEDVLNTAWHCEFLVVPDEQSIIEKSIKQLADERDCSLILTTGGTGPSPRDITPEATEAVCDKMLPGFGELMRAESLKHVPTAILSRQTAGIRGQCLVINLPGKPRAIRECLDAVFAAVPYCIDLIGGDYLETNPSVLTAFRPKAK